MFAFPYSSHRKNSILLLLAIEQKEKSLIGQKRRSQVSDEINSWHGAEIHFYMAGMGHFYSAGMVRAKPRECSTQILSVISTLSE